MPEEGRWPWIWREGFTVAMHTAFGSYRSMRDCIQLRVFLKKAKEASLLCFIKVKQPTRAPSLARWKESPSTPLTEWLQSEDPEDGKDEARALHVFVPRDVQGDEGAQRFGALGPEVIGQSSWRLKGDSTLGAD